MRQTSLKERCFFCGETPFDAIHWALKKAGGNKAKAARIIGVKRTTLLERCKTLNIPLKQEDRCESWL